MCKYSLKVGSHKKTTSQTNLSNTHNVKHSYHFSPCIGSPPRLVDDNANGHKPWRADAVQCRWWSYWTIILPCFYLCDASTDSFYILHAQKLHWGDEKILNFFLIVDNILSLGSPPNGRWPRFVPSIPPPTTTFSAMVPMGMSGKKKGKIWWIGVNVGWWIIDDDETVLVWRRV